MHLPIPVFYYFNCISHKYTLSIAYICIHIYMKRQTNVFCMKRWSPQPVRWKVCFRVKTKIAKILFIRTNNCCQYGEYIITGVWKGSVKWWNACHIYVRMMASTSNDEEKLLSMTDKYFIEQRNIVLQEINETMNSILNGLNGLNISLESSIAVGREFQSVSDLWKTFYDGLESIPDEVPIDEQPTLSLSLIHI